MTPEQIKQAMHILLHASHGFSLPDEATARFLHDVILGISGIYGEPWPEEFDAFVSRIWLYQTVLRKPAVSWGIGDAFKVTPDPEVQTIFVLPTNTDLATSASVVVQAKKALGDQPFAELKNHGSAKLGDVIETTGRYLCDNVSVCHLVCRKAGYPDIQTLNLPERASKPTQYIIPLFGKHGELGVWVEALAELRSDKNIQFTNPATALVMVSPEQKSIGFELERQLIRKGVLVGRDMAVGVPYPDDDIVAGCTHETSLAPFVSPDGPLTPVIYAKWVNSGIGLPSKAWKFHERVMRGEA